MVEPLANEVKALLTEIRAKLDEHSKRFDALSQSLLEQKEMLVRANQTLRRQIEQVETVH